MPYIAQVADGRQDCLSIFGNHYNTIDGTGSRDYIHVVDLAHAHIRALDSKLFDNFEILNVGGGKGTTVLELVENFQNVSGQKIKYKYLPRREGDIASSWADFSKAYQKMGWQPEKHIKQICEDTWRWHKLNPTGYKRE